MPQQREESSTKIPVNSSFVAKPVKCPRAKINWALIRPVDPELLSPVIILQLTLRLE
jgi:hypothetical protein